jgi:hypothetical protein
MGQIRNTHNMVVGKLKTRDEPRKPARKPTDKMKDNIKMDLMEIGCEGSE